MKRNKVIFEFTQDWGSIKKGTRKGFRIAFARSLQDVDKVGKIVREKPPAKKAPAKAVKPPANKVDKTPKATK